MLYIASFILAVAVIQGVFLHQRHRQQIDKMQKELNYCKHFIEKSFQDNLDYLRTIKIPFWRIILLKLLRTKVCYGDAARQVKTGQAILICNHQSLLDGIIIALASPSPLVFAVNSYHAKTNKFTRLLLTTLSSLGLGVIVSLDPSKPFALRQLLKEYQGGKSLLIFPEGKISKDGALLPFMGGYRWLAAKLDAPILNLVIDGAHKSKLFAKTGDKFYPRITLKF